MITDIPQDVKTQIINNRLQGLSRQYFEVQLDMEQAKANGSSADEIARVQSRLTQLENAYTAVEALLPAPTA